jgi:tRNA (guanosine-2'-O-)-methyltransferase
VRQLDGTGLKRLHRDWRRRTTGRLALLLDNVQQPYNVGAILRLAAAYRVEHLWLVGATASPLSSAVGKTALGSERYLTWTVADHPEPALDELTADGWRLIGLELTDDARPIHESSLGLQACLAIGHEDRGLSRAVLDGCTETVFIPQLGRIGSLNVASSAAIALYETRRQEWVTG